MLAAAALASSSRPTFAEVAVAGTVCKGITLPGVDVSPEAAHLRRQEANGLAPRRTSYHHEDTNGCKNPKT